MTEVEGGHRSPRAVGDSDMRRGYAGSPRQAGASQETMPRPAILALGAPRARRIIGHRRRHRIRRGSAAQHHRPTHPAADRRWRRRLPPDRKPAADRRLQPLSASPRSPRGPDPRRRAMSTRSATRGAGHAGGAPSVTDGRSSTLRGRSSASPSHPADEPRRPSQIHAVRRRPAAVPVYLLTSRFLLGERTADVARSAMARRTHCRGDDDGPSPVEALLAGVAGCFVRNLRWVADGAHVVFDRIELRLA